MSGPLSFLLPILAMFSTPLTLQEALASAAGKAGLRHEWVAKSAAIVQLAKAGVLETEGDAVSRLVVSRGFDSASAHILMLNDVSRTSAYLRALRQEVRETDVVLELGTGTGVLAAAAAQYGAKHVYALEGTSISTVARALFKSNNLHDRITLIEGVSSRVELPERVDLIVSELIGSEPLAERVLEYTRDALARFGKPTTRMLPRRLIVSAQAVEVPEQVLADRIFTPAAVERWQTDYGLDFNSLLDARSLTAQRFSFEPQRIKHWRTLSEPVQLLNVDLCESSGDMVDSVWQAQTNAGGTISGIVVWFKIDLTDDVSISTQPSLAAADCSWTCKVWLTDPVAVTPGRDFEVHYTHSPVRTALTFRML